MKVPVYTAVACPRAHSPIVILEGAKSPLLEEGIEIGGPTVLGIYYDTVVPILQERKQAQGWGTPHPG